LPVAAVAVVWLALAVLVPGPSLAAWAVGEAATVLLLAGVVLALWVLPGLALLRVLAPDAALGWGSRLAMALGCSIALPPLLLELASLIGLPWNRWTTVAYIALALAVVVSSFKFSKLRVARTGGNAKTQRRKELPDRRTTTGNHPVHRSSLIVHRSPRPFLNAQFSILNSLLLLGLLGLGFVLRLYVMRELPTGLWGDSYHHTMIAQLLVEHHGLFRSWEPYAPLTTFTYHFGFHANVAFFHWLTGVSVPRSLLYTGQIINWATLPAAFLLARQLTRSRWAAVLAVLLTGFVNQQPLYFINWGRYTQLDGQAMLPALFVAWMLLLEARGARREARGERHETRGDRGTKSSFLLPLASRLAPFSRLVPRASRLLLAALLTASMMLTHYVVTLFAALLVGVYIVLLFAVRWPAWTNAKTQMAVRPKHAPHEAHAMSAASPWRMLRPYPLRIAGRALLAAGLAILLAAPWLANTLGGYLVRNVAGNAGTGESQATAPAGLPPIDASAVLPILLGLAVLGAVFALARREWRAGVLAVWALLLVAVTQPYVLGLPGTGVVTTLAAYIALYLPLLPLAAYALATPLEALARRSASLAGGIVMVAVLGCSVWGLRWQQNVVDPEFQHVRPADVRAMEWIRDNTEPDARFLVNMLPAYGSLMVGTDGGWWIPLLAGRQTTLPPVTYGSERSSIAGFSKQVREFGYAIREHPPASPDGLALMRNAGIEYIYTGAHQAPRTDNVIDVATLRASPDYQVVYEQGGVVIFRLRRE